jgi:hypothetical protein
VSTLPLLQVPVVVVDGVQVNDSSAIISRLAAEVEATQRGGGGSGGKKGGLLASLFGSGSSSGSSGAASSVGGPAAESVAEEEKWRRWVDDWFVKVRWRGGSRWRGVGWRRRSGRTEQQAAA